MGVGKQTQMDPLYVIFEQHLYNFQDSDSDRRTFINNIIQDYFSYLRKQNITVPKSLESAIGDELFTQVSHMLVKKIYGCLTIDDYQKKIPAVAKRRVRARYSRLATKKA